MKLKDLKQTWNKLPGKDLDEAQIRKMLEKKTGTLIENIDRNIKVGFVVIFLLILVFTLDDFLFTPLIMKGMNLDFNFPDWLLYVSMFSYVLLFTTFLLFVFKYYRTKKSYDINCNLKETLLKTVNTLTTYRRVFYLAITVLLVAIGLGFVTGMYQGYADGTMQHNILLSDIQPTKILLVSGIGIVLLALLIGTVFFFLRWGFRKLYGNYTDQLKVTLRELQDIED
ncbi:MAG: hypothetical protein CSA36_06785 [Draconibacterium sp.]|nr:MAG: hypothetical protein CSA36_06785 [Draconibacterium sp.]